MNLRMEGARAEALWVESRVRLPRGPGSVEAWSKPANRATVINWKYVRDHPEIYPKWRENPYSLSKVERQRRWGW